MITERAHIPIISIGAGPDCDGQCLIFHDMFGLYPNFTPKFAKRYADIGEMLVKGFSQYVHEVRTGVFPQKEHCFSISDKEFDELSKFFEEK